MLSSGHRLVFRPGGGSARTALRLIAWWAANVLGLVLADTVRLAPAKDTTLFESAPNDNMGGWTHLAAGTTGNQGDRTRNRGLLAFDVAGALPPGVQVTNVVLSVTVTRVPGTSGGGGPISSIFALHRVLRAWGEGDKLGDRGFPAQAGEATWNWSLAPDQAWSAPGGAPGADFVTVPSASAFVSGAGTYQFGPSTELTADVQSWLDHPGANFGWVLLSQSESKPKTARGFGSREDPDHAPVLTVQFAPAEPLRLYARPWQTNSVQLGFLAPPGRALAVEAATRLADAPWETLTDLPATPAGTNWTLLFPIDAPHRFYRLKGQ